MSEYLHCDFPGCKAITKPDVSGLWGRVKTHVNTDHGYVHHEFHFCLECFKLVMEDTFGKKP